METKIFKIKLEFDLKEFDKEKLTDQYVLGIVKSKLERQGIKISLSRL